MMIWAIFKSKGRIFWLDYRFWQLLSIFIIVLKLIFEMLSFFWSWNMIGERLGGVGAMVTCICYISIAGIPGCWHRMEFEEEVMRGRFLQIYQN
jgi:uncharacterized membrane protein YuzA (DUF378 family)